MPAVLFASEPFRGLSAQVADCINFGAPSTLELSDPTYTPRFAQVRGLQSAALIFDFFCS